MAKSEKSPHVVVVDPYSSGMYVVQELQLQQVPMIGVQSSQEMSQFWLDQYDETLFEYTIKHETLEKTVAELQKFNVAAVIPGSEPGVFVAEELQKGMGVLGNDPATSNWRRHKYHMQERLRELGLRAIRQTFAGSVEECLEWQKKWNKWPIIIKPALSAGTVGLYWCNNAADCKVAFAKECGKMNLNGNFNDKLVCQEFLDGLEYIVDCTSFKGKHLVNCMWVYQKTRLSESKAIISEWSSTINARGEIQDKLVKYVFNVLDALGIENGPSHSEVIMVDGEPCLVETGARLHGLKGPKLMEIATGIGAHELAVDIFLHGARMFNHLYASNYRYILKKWVVTALFCNTKKEGILAKDICVEKTKQLKSVIDARLTVSKGDYLSLTRDLSTIPGYFVLVHQSWQQILDDIKFVRDLEESTDFYSVEPAQKPADYGAYEMSVLCSSPRKEPARAPIVQFEEDALQDIEFSLDGLIGVEC